MTESVSLHMSPSLKTRSLFLKKMDEIYTEKIMVMITEIEH